MQMGRHGGGSRSGGSSRSSSSSRSSGGSRGGGVSRIRTSATPFIGCYNRSYYDRRGRLHNCYTSDRNFGTKSGWNAGKIIALIFITFHMMCMMCSMLAAGINLGGKVQGDKDRIFIEDRADLLTEAEEHKVLELFGEVYDASGMPITLYTDDFSWKDHYRSLEVYSEELYYQIGYDEDAMLIVFTAETVDGFDDWEYDMYCGDDTIKCFSDDAFDEVLSNFQKGMAKQNLAEALDYAWNSVMKDLGKTHINWEIFPIMIFLALFYSVFYIAILAGTGKANAAYKYFRKNPQQLSMTPITTIYSSCPNCGASNSTGGETCQFCGSLLKAQEGNTQYIHPDNM